jgi:hypothetical protein
MIHERTGQRVLLHSGRFRGEHRFHRRRPIALRRAIRSTNLLERQLVEERRWLKIIPNAFDEKLGLQFVFGVMIRLAPPQGNPIRFSLFCRSGRSS